jgi:amidophosphoribosyltransferase
MGDGKKYTEDEITEKVRQLIGADFLGYNDSMNLAAAIGMDANSMCFTCSSGDYSTLGIKPIFKTRAEIKGE